MHKQSQMLSYSPAVPLNFSLLYPACFTVLWCTILPLNLIVLAIVIEFLRLFHFEIFGFRQVGMYALSTSESANFQYAQLQSSKQRVVKSSESLHYTMQPSTG